MYILLKKKKTFSGHWENRNRKRLDLRRVLVSLNMGNKDEEWIVKKGLDDIRPKCEEWDEEANEGTQ